MREGQARQLIDNVLASSQYPALVCGDWNDTPDSAALAVVRNTQGISSAAGFYEPEFTTHKYRPTTGMQTRTIDHFYFFERMPGQSAPDNIKKVSGHYALPIRP